MKHKLYNTVGQVVGEYDEVTKIYHTIRDVKKSEIFVKKKWFGGTYMDLPVAIDKAILYRLISFGCTSIQILILGVLNRSYVVCFSPMWIKDNSVEINYDSKQSKRWGSQLVFDSSKGVSPNQSSLV